VAIGAHAGTHQHHQASQGWRLSSGTGAFVYFVPCTSESSHLKGWMNEKRWKILREDSAVASMYTAQQHHTFRHVPMVIRSTGMRCNVFLPIQKHVSHPVETIIREAHHKVTASIPSKWKHQQGD